MSMLTFHQKKRSLHIIAITRPTKLISLILASSVSGWEDDSSLLMVYLDNETLMLTAIEQFYN